MDIRALENSITRKVLAPVYLFYGEENYLKETYVKKFIDMVPDGSRDFNVDLFDGSDKPISEVIGAALSLPFMTEKRVVVLKNATIFKGRKKNTGDGEEEEKGSESDKILLEYLENPVESTCLVICCDNIDKKRKIYKAIDKAGQVVEFTNLKGADLNAWIDHKARSLGKKIEPAAVAKLITSVGSDLTQLTAELEKLSIYNANSSAITASDIETLVSRTAESSIFDLVDAVAEKKYEQSVKLARQMVFLGEPVIRIVYMIARQFRLLLLAKDLFRRGYAEKGIASELRIHPFVAQKCVRQSRHFSLEELKSCLEQILKTDSDIKNGRSEPIIALELLIIALSNNR